jgi:hypothetical protein
MTTTLTAPATTTSDTSTYESLLAGITAPGGCEVLDPATGEVIGRAPVGSVEDLDAAVARARAAQPPSSGRHRGGCRAARRAALPRAGEAPQRPQRPVRGRRVRRLAARHRGNRAPGRDRSRRRRHPRRAALPTGRCRPGDRSAELADDDHHVAGRPGPADGHHRGDDPVRRGQEVRPRARVRSGWPQGGRGAPGDQRPRAVDATPPRLPRGSGRRHARP